MNMLEKYQSLIILLAVGAGLALGQFAVIENYAGAFITPFLLIMLYGVFLAIPLSGLKKAFSHIKFFSTSVMINFIWSPLLAFLLGSLFLSDHSALWLGFILFMVTPCTDWYLIFTSIAKGNTTLSTSILPVNLILQVVFIPVYLFIFAGTVGNADMMSILEGVFLILFIPFIIAAFTRLILTNQKEILTNALIPFFSYAQIIFLSLAITAMFASQGNYLLNNLEVILIMLIPILLFFFINFVLSQSAGKLFNFNFEDTVSLSMTTIARNSPVALAVVLAVFPDQPLIALALIIGPLIELPVLGLIARILLKIRYGAL